VLANSIETLGSTVMGILSLIHPLPWPGTFIPVLPLRLVTALEAPFAYLMGFNSRYADLLYNDGIDRYFVLNTDAKYAASVGMEDYPLSIMQLLDKTVEKVKSVLTAYHPIFPFVIIRKKIRKFIIRFLAISFGSDYHDYRVLCSEYSKRKDLQSEEFPVLLCQTQFVSEFMEGLDGDPSDDVIEAFWPKSGVVGGRKRGRKSVKSTFSGHIGKPGTLKQAPLKSLGSVKDAFKLIFPEEGDIESIREDEKSDVPVLPVVPKFSASLEFSESEASKSSSERSSEQTSEELPESS
jgi:hypothetical protein